MIKLSDAISSLIESRLMDLDICLPVEVVKWNKSDLTADVKPEFDSLFFSGDIIEATTILDVPILYPMSSDSAIVYPLKAGDKGVIVVSQRNLDDWKENGSRTPSDSTIFPLGSCFLMAGVTHKNMTKQHSKTKEAMGIYGKKLFLGDANATPDPSSTLQSRDLIEMLKVALEQLKTATYPSAVGPAGPMVAPQLTVIEGIIAELGELQA